MKDTNDVVAKENELHCIFPCRRAQVNLLLSVLGMNHEHTWPTVFIYGQSGTGKSSIVRTTLSKLKVPHAVVSCVEAYSCRVLFEHILDLISGVVPSFKNNYEHFASCDNMNDFVRHLIAAIEAKGLNGQTVYLVLDNAERLRDIDSNLLPGFLKLKELLRMNVCVILISEIVWEKFRTGTSFQDPFPIYFPNYSKAELAEILSHKIPNGHSKELYGNYINLLLSVFYQACRNLTELQYLASLNFAKYYEPIENKEAKPTDVRKLWRNIEPHFKKALQTVYLHEISSEQWKKMQLPKNEDNSDTSATNRILELPFYSKYLLIAAYLASYNPAKSDKRFFVKNHRKIGKISKIHRNSKVDNQLLGPKIFPLDRMLAIFYAIAEDKVAPSALIYSQIASLVSLHLLAQVEKTDLLQMPKYKCLVSLDFIRTIARNVNFDIVRYLYDFL